MLLMGSPAVKSTKRVHNKNNSRANIQEVLSEAEGEGTEWIECDNFCDLKSSIDSSYFDKLTVMAFAWSICMGFIHSLLDFGWTTCVRSPWDMIAIPLFWQSTIFWYTLAYFVGTPFPPNTPSRRVKRSVARHKRRKNCNMPSLFFGSMAWMVLVGSILIPTAALQGPAHPFSTLTRQLEGAYTHIQRLDEAVDLSPSTFMQYQSLEAHKLWKEIKTEDKKNEVNGHGCSFKIDESEFFDAYENLPVYREEFCGCLEKFESENYDTWTRRDLLDLDGAYRDRVVVDCCGTSYVMLLSMDVCTTYKCLTLTCIALACITLTRLSITLPALIWATLTCLFIIYIAMPYPYTTYAYMHYHYVPFYFMPYQHMHYNNMPFH
jgi:hypothetical protein